MQTIEKIRKEKKYNRNKEKRERGEPGSVGRETVEVVGEVEGAKRARDEFLVVTNREDGGRVTMPLL